MKLRKFFIVLIIFYFFIIVLKIFLFKYTFSEFRGRSEDAFLWSFCAVEFSKGKIPSLIPNFHFQVAYLNNFEVPAYLVGCISPIFTLFLFIFLKAFGTIYIFIIFLFFVSLLNLYVIYKILEFLNISEEAKIYTFASILFSPMFLIFSFKLRPDPLALLFALLSILFIFKRRFIISGILFSISVFGFKIQIIAWIFFLIYLIRNIKHIIFFLAVLFISFTLWFFIFYFPIINKYPNLISYLLYSNTILISDLEKIILNHNYILNVVQTIGIFNIYGVLYLLGCFQFIFYLRISEIIPSRSFNPIILSFSSGYIYNNFPKLKNLFRFILFLQIVINILFSLIDLKINLNNDKFYKKLEEISRDNSLKVCSFLRESNFYLHLFYPDRDNLVYFFSRRSVDINYLNCDVLTYYDISKKVIIHNDKIYHFNDEWIVNLMLKFLFKN